HAEGTHRGQTPLIPDQNRIIDSLRLGVLSYVIRIIDRNPDNFEAIWRMFATESLQEGDLTAAGLTPGCPEIDHQGAAFPVRETVHGAIGVRQPDLRQLRRDLSWRRRRLLRRDDGVLGALRELSGELDDGMHRVGPWQQSVSD